MEDARDTLDVEAVVSDAASEAPGTAASARDSRRPSVLSVQVPEDEMVFQDLQEGAPRRSLAPRYLDYLLPVRHLSVKVMNALADEQLLEENWMEKPQQHLDFSDKELFLLDTFKPEDFSWGGLVKEKDRGKDARSRATAADQEPTMPVYKLRTLNLDNNFLKDDDFEPWSDKASTKGLSGVVFRSLEVLRMRRNQLSYPMLLMPRLRELHLSYNAIVRIPPLAGLKQLEVLILSHNRIDMVDEHQLKDTTNLKRLHLNDNMIKIDATNFYQVLMALTAAREFENLQLQGNPFCSYLNEYQIFVAWFLPKLKRIDDIDLSKSKSLRESMREEAKRAGMDGDQEAVRREFRRLDEQVQLRTRAEGARNGRLQELQGIQRSVPVKIDLLIRELDEVLIDSSNLVTSVTLVYEHASQLTKDGPGHYNSIAQNMFPDARSKRSETDPKAWLEGLSATFVQQASLLAERYPEGRPWLLRTLAKFCPIEQHRLGEYCLIALATLAKGSKERLMEVLGVVEEMLVPFVAEKKGHNPSGDGSWETVVVGLSKLSCPELGDLLAESVVPYLGVWYKYVMAQQHLAKLKSALTVLLRCSVQEKAHALKVIDEAFLRDASHTLLASKSWKADRFSDYLGVGGILEGCIRSCSEKVISILRKEDFPRKLLKLIRGVLDEQANRDESKVEQLVVSKKVAAALDLLRLMMEDPAVLHDLVEKDKEDQWMGHTLLLSPAQASPDPLILASSLSCLETIMRDKSVRNLYLDMVIEQLQLDKNPNKVVPRISAKRFQDLHVLCEKHSALQDDFAVADCRDGVHTTPMADFGQATDPNGHKTLVSIVHFITLFPMYASVSQQCKEVSEKMDEQGRDALLFKLLWTPSNEVRVAVLRFLENATNQLDEFEQRQLVDMLNPSNVGQELPLLKSLLETLQRFLCEEGENGDVFRSKYAGQVLAKAFEVLAANAERNTFGNHSEEEQKVALSREAVALLAAASQQPFLRMVRDPRDPSEELMRCDEIALDFRNVIRLEESLHSPSMPDVCLELTWTGRSIHILLGFLNPLSSEALLSNKKQGFRVFSRIADIVAGTGDRGFRGTRVLEKQLPASAEDRAAAEAKMWNLTQMRLDINRMDDHEYGDRLHQQDHFVSFHGLDQMLHFLEHGLTHRGHGEAHAPAAEAQGPMVRLMEDQRAAKETLASLVEHAHNRKIEKAQRNREHLSKEEPDVIPLPEVDKASTVTGEALARKFFIEDAWKLEMRQQEAEVKLQGNVAPVVPKHLRTKTEGFMDEHGSVPLQYYAAALLRCVYAILVVPMDKRFKEVMTKELQSPSMHARLLALLEYCGSYVHCNIIAKFLRIMSMVLHLQPHNFRGIDRDGEGLHTEVIIAATFACKCIYMIAPLLESVGREYMLTQEQQTLVEEAVRLLRSTSHTVMAMRMSDMPDIQAECLELAFDVVLPMPAVRGIFMCLLYDVQAGIGSLHGSSISKHFVESMYERQEFHELCSEVLSIMVTTSDRTRYEVLELVNKFKVLKRLSVHTSFLKQLMDNTEICNFTLAMQQMLDRQPLQGEETAIEYFMGEWEAKTHESNENVGISFVSTTDFYITALGRPVSSCVQTAKVTLWSASSRRSLASVEIGPPADEEEPPGPYLYRPLEPPVLAERGKEYRLTQECAVGVEYLWHDGFISPSEASALAAHRYARLLGGVSGPLNACPGHNDGELRRAGMLNFLIMQREWIRHCLDIELLQCGGGLYGLTFSAKGTYTRMIITNKRLLLMVVPRGGFKQANPHSLAKGISQEFRLNDLIRITCHTDTQMLILGFVVQSRLGTTSEQLICVVLHKSDVRQRVLETLTELSAPSVQAQVYPTRDVLVDQAINRRTSSSVLCMSYAFHDDVLLFYVLTQTEFCEFEPHFEDWAPAPKELPFTGDEDRVGSKDDAKLVKRLKAELQSGSLHPSRFTAAHADHLNARNAALIETHIQHYHTFEENLGTGADQEADPEQQKQIEKDMEMFRQAQQKTLRPLRKPAVQQLMEVEFESGEHPVLALTFQRFVTTEDRGQEKFRIRFLDDVARERWRRCLALVLRGQSDHAVHWDRHWAGAGQ